MSFTATAISAVERVAWPDSLTRAGVAYLCGRSAAELAAVPAGAAAEFARSMVDRPVAEHTDAANTQHYELPPEFFAQVLGPRRKYSSCLYPKGSETLEEAEVLALDETMAHAELRDGHRILELGCGWGSLSLTMAERFPESSITAISNSRPQRQFIEAQAAARGFKNLTVITADMNAFVPQGLFDRIVSVEMFEHMANWRTLLGRVRAWLAPGGKFFMHVFSHVGTPYRFDTGNDADWIARHFFTGGIMPSHDLIRQFSDLFTVEEDWRWSGSHYERTAAQWLENFDMNVGAIDPVLRQVYGGDARLWRRRWRLFFLATEGLFGHAGGSVWGVSHYRMRATA
jgi:cyclopropane-fatty-acyl-phospholipid synthase